MKGGFSADKMLMGAAKIDRQYQKFIKVLAFSDLWFSNFLNKKNRVVLSYNWKLRSLQSYIQQLEMESLGKKANPKSIFKQTGQSIFGGLDPPLNTLIFNCYIRAQQNFVPILFILPQPIAHY